MVERFFDFALYLQHLRDFFMGLTEVALPLKIVWIAVGELLRDRQRFLICAKLCVCHGEVLLCGLVFRLELNRCFQLWDGIRVVAQLIKHCANSINICGTAHSRVVSYCLFGRHVTGRAKDIQRLGDTAFRFDQSGETKIG